MKQLKKLVCILLALTLLMGLTIPAFAAESGSITINGINDGITYEIYRLLDLESYNAESGAYSYTVNSAWTEFFATDEAAEYFDVNTQGYATWKGAEDDDRVAAFATLALAYANTNKISPLKSSENAGEFVITGTSGKFSDLPLGYYLVDSTAGALCALTTTTPNASLEEKNLVPTIDKQVKEDSTNQWGDSNTADIGQIVEFRVIINVQKGAEDYVLHDKMSNGLTFQEVTKVEHIIGSNTTEVSADHYTVVTEGLSDDCTFEVRFSQEFCNELENDEQVVVYYTAILNENAVIAGSGNPNEAWLEYGEDHETTHDQTITYTFGFDLVKTDSLNKLIDGAEFRIYDAAEGGNEVPVVKIDDYTYRHAKEGETGVPIVVKDGKVRVIGFDNGTYYLEETKAPAGYNQLTGRQPFSISDANKYASVADNTLSTDSGIQVINNSGTVLPETGGMGTTMLYVVGTLMVIGAVVLLITKKRMKADD